MRMGLGLRVSSPFVPPHSHRARMGVERPGSQPCPTTNLLWDLREAIPLSGSSSAVANALQEFLKHAVPDSLVRGTDFFP